MYSSSQSLQVGGKNRREAKSFPTILIERSSDSKAVGPGEETDGFAFVPPICRFRGGILGCRTGAVGIHSLAQRYGSVFSRTGFLGPRSAYRAFAWEKEEAPTGSVCRGRVFHPTGHFVGRAATTLRDAGGSEAITRQCRD